LRVVWVVLLAGCPAAVDLSTPRDYPCRPDAGDSQCPPDMRCGLEQRCHLRGFPAPYACASDGDCELDWRCGLNGICHAPDVATNYACRSDADCELGWRCGLEGTCHSRDVAAAYTCHTRQDCELGWKCGLEGTCHAPDAGGAFACIDDSQCDNGWRCGFDGHCLDASADALRADASFGDLVAERLSPAASEGYPDFVATSNTEVMATVRGNTLRWSKSVYQPQPREDGGITWWETLEAALSEPPRDVWADIQHVYVLDDLGVLTISWTDDGGSFSRDDAGAGALRYRNGALLTQQTLSVEPYWLPHADGGVQTLYDVASGGPIIAAEDGMFDVYQGKLTPLAVQGVPNAWCGEDDSGVRVRRFLDQTTLALNTGELLIGAYPVACSPSGAPAVAAGRCQPCSPGFEIADALSLGQTLARVFCADRDGGRQEDFIATANGAGGCDRSPVLPSERIDREPSLVGHAMDHSSSHAGSHGQVWDLMASTSFFRALLLDRPLPIYLLGGAPTAVLEDPLASFGVEYRFQPDLGMVWTMNRNDPSPLSAVDGHLSWVRMGWNNNYAVVDLSTGASVAVAYTGYDAASIAVPVGSVMLSTARDQLFTADFQPPDGGVLPWPVLRVVPEPYVPIISLTAVDGPGEISGYALTNNALHEFHGPDGLPWRTARVPMPEHEWVKVWTDGTRGRLGYRDGTVYALPSRVPIAPPLPAGQQVGDYTTLCNAALALAPNGLYRLDANPDAGPIGVWIEQNLDSAISPARTDRGLSDGQLWRDGDTLYLVTGFGTLVRLHPAGGCP
jgi:hypothetical protein